ncbi:MAG: phosphomannomutase [Campylobacterales bacterium]|nr:phosphomannomutase [Campylobacterales bacterium]
MKIYPAAIVSSGVDNETTPVSLEWFDVLSKQKVELIGFSIFVHFNDGKTKEFRYANRELLEEATKIIASQM